MAKEIRSRGKAKGWMGTSYPFVPYQPEHQPMMYGYNAPLTPGWSGGFPYQANPTNVQPSLYTRNQYNPPPQPAPSVAGWQPNTLDQGWYRNQAGRLYGLNPVWEGGQFRGYDPNQAMNRWGQPVGTPGPMQKGGAKRRPSGARGRGAVSQGEMEGLLAEVEQQLAAWQRPKWGTEERGWGMGPAEKWAQLDALKRRKELITKMLKVRGWQGGGGAGVQPAAGGQGVSMRV